MQEQARTGFSWLPAFLIARIFGSPTVRLRGYRFTKFYATFAGVVPIIQVIRWIIGCNFSVRHRKSWETSMTQRIET